MSYAMLPADLVIAAAQRYLEDRQAYLQSLEENALTERIERSQPGFIGRLLGRKPLTPEAAREAYHHSNQYLFDCAHGKRWANEAQGVLALARQALPAKVPVCLNAELALIFEQAGVFKL